ncbi:hypothetical protein FPOAC2_05311 [Fusarium poae]
MLRAAREWRKYPVVFFHKARFPHECELGWVSVSDLEPYDPCDNSIDHRHKQQVNAFLSNYENVENTGIQGTNGNNVAEPETFHDCLPSLHHSSPAAEESDFSRDSSLLLYDNDIEYEKSLAARTRENSSRVKEEVVQLSPMDMSGGPIRNRDVRASEHSAMPDQEEQDSQAFDPRPVYVQDDYLMDVDSHGDTVNDDTMTTLEKQLTLKEYRAIVNGMSPQSSTTPLRDPVRPQAEFANMSVDAQAGLSSAGVLISHDAVANPVLLHTETSMHDVPHSPNIGRRSLHDLYRQMNRHSTVEGHGALQQTIRSDGGTMWTLTETADGTPSRALYSSYPEQRKRKRPQPSMFIPRRR